MSTENWLALAGLLVTVIGSIAGVAKSLIKRIEDGDEKVRNELKTTDTKWGATQAKSDLDFTQFKELIDTEFMRRREYEISQKNTERRLESIETKVDKIPDSLDRLSERLIAVMSRQ